MVIKVKTKLYPVYKLTYLIYDQFKYNVLVHAYIIKMLPIMIIALIEEKVCKRKEYILPDIGDNYPYYMSLSPDTDLNITYNLASSPQEQF